MNEALISSTADEGSPQFPTSGKRMFGGRICHYDNHDEYMNNMRIHFAELNVPDHSRSMPGEKELVRLDWYVVTSLRAPLYKRFPTILQNAINLSDEGTDVYILHKGAEKYVNGVDFVHLCILAKVEGRYTAMNIAQLDGAGVT
jgi:hypothetical protein